MQMRHYPYFPWRKTLQHHSITYMHIRICIEFRRFWIYDQLKFNSIKWKFMESKSKTTTFQLTHNLKKLRVAKIFISYFVSGICAESVCVCSCKYASKNVLAFNCYLIIFWHKLNCTTKHQTLEIFLNSNSSPALVRSLARMIYDWRKSGPKIDSSKKLFIHLY